MAPEVDEEGKLNDKMAKEAGVDELKGFDDLAMIDEYAQAYGQLPRTVLAESFDNVMPLIVYWFRKKKFNNKLNEVRKKYKVTGNEQSN